MADMRSESVLRAIAEMQLRRNQPTSILDHLFNSGNAQARDAMRGGILNQGNAAGSYSSPPMPGLLGEIQQTGNMLPLPPPRPPEFGGDQKAFMEWLMSQQAGMR